MALGTFGEFLLVFSNKVKSAITPLNKGLEVLSTASDKAKLLSENFSKNSNLDDQVSLYLLSLLELKLHSISVTPKIHTY